MRRRTLGAVLLLLTALNLATVQRVAAQSPRPHDRSHTDPQLRQQIERARRGSLISVEVLTADNISVERSINRLGGTVTGAVDGQLVQAFVPADAVEQLATDSAVRYVQRPLRIDRVPPQEAIGSGTVVGAEVQLTNAAAWQQAGIMGNVRVGIIDSFDLTKWNITEVGPVPDAAHQFCPDVTEGLCSAGQINPSMGDRHGVAVAEIIKDMAPGAELFLATTTTTAELQAAIDWFVLNGVHIVNRSIGAPYDGPGDGTGPLDAVVDHAAAHGITWFNSGGNDAAFGYGRYTDGVDASGYVDFLNGPSVDTMLRIDPQNGGVVFDGIRWANDWYLPPDAVTDYSVEIWRGTSESSATLMLTLDDPQTLGAPPLEAVDEVFDVSAGQALFLRIRAGANHVRRRLTPSRLPSSSA